jgi:hypothetical protein
MRPVNDQDWLADRFRASRPKRRAIASRMPGSLSKADDALRDDSVSSTTSRISQCVSRSAHGNGPLGTHAPARPACELTRRLGGAIDDRRDLVEGDGRMSCRTNASRSTASGEGDFGRLVAVLDSDVVLRADFGLARGWQELRGAEAVAADALGCAQLYAQPGLDIRPALINGVAGIVAFRHGQPLSGAVTTGTARSSSSTSQRPRAACRPRSAVCWKIDERHLRIFPSDWASR